MEIVRWLSDSMSAISGNALIRVEPRETADIEKMLALVDGNSVGHFGLSASLVSLAEFPKIKPMKSRGKVMQGHFELVEQFGFPRASAMKNEARYYKVHVSRD